MEDLAGIGKLAEQGIELVKAKPVYEDVVQPGAKEAGKAIATVGQAVNAALAPLRLVVWGIDQVEAFLKSALAERLQHVPAEHITTPSPQVIGPAVESLRFVAENTTLRNMYASLIATSMDSRIARSAHPAFVEILKQITPHEAKILGLAVDGNIPVIEARLSGWYRGASLSYSAIECWADIAAVCECGDDSLTESYLINMRRLGLIEFDFKRTSFGNEDRYLTMRQSAFVKVATASAIKRASGETVDFEFAVAIEDGIATLTELGRLLATACGLKPPDPPP